MKKTNLILCMLPLLCLAACGENQSKGESSQTTEEGPLNGYYEDVEDEEGNLYTGFFKDGLYDGFGEIEYMTGTIYTGQFSEGQWEGTGHILWDSGCIYIGETHASLMHGIGYMLWTMGDYYVGDWTNGNPNGWGLKGYMVNSMATSNAAKYNYYMGEFVDNLKVGYGLMRYSFGDVYYGEWKGDVRSGLGTVIWEDASSGTLPECLYFTGEFKNDWINGEGTMYYRDGRVIHGFWDGTELLEDKPHTLLSEGTIAPTSTVEDIDRMVDAIPETTEAYQLLSWAGLEM